MGSWVHEINIPKLLTYYYRAHSVFDHGIKIKKKLDGSQLSYSEAYLINPLLTQSDICV